MEHNEEKEENSWERPWSFDEMRQEAATKWSLAGDSGLHNFLMLFSQQLLNRFHEVSKKLDDFHDDVGINANRVNDIFNGFIMLSNTQFVENRVYEEDLTVSKEDEVAQSSKQKSREELEAELLPKIKEMLHKGLAVVGDSYTVSTSDSLIAGVNLQPLNVYKKKPLPCLIGTEDFKNIDPWLLVGHEVVQEVPDIDDVQMESIVEKGIDSDNESVHLEQGEIPPKKAKPSHDDLFSIPTEEEKRGGGGLFDSSDDDELAIDADMPDSEEAESKQKSPDNALMDALKAKLNPGSRSSSNISQNALEQSTSGRSSLSSGGLWAEPPTLPAKDAAVPATQKPKGLFDDDDDDDDLFAITSKTPERKATRGLSVVEDEPQDITATEDGTTPTASKPKDTKVSLFDSDDDDDVAPSPPPIPASQKGKSKYVTDLFGDDSTDDDELFGSRPIKSVSNDTKVPKKKPVTPAKATPTKVGKNLFDSSSGDEEDLFNTAPPQQQAKPQKTSTKPTAVPTKPAPKLAALPVSSLFGSLSDDDDDTIISKRKQKTQQISSSIKPDHPQLEKKPAKSKPTKTKGLFDDSSSDDDLFGDKKNNTVPKVAQSKLPDTTKNRTESIVEKGSTSQGELQTPEQEQPEHSTGNKKPIGGVSMFGAGGDSLLNALKTRAHSVDTAADKENIPDITPTSRPEPPQSKQQPGDETGVVQPLDLDKEPDDSVPSILPSIGRQRARVGPPRRKPTRVPKTSDSDLPNLSQPVVVDDSEDKVSSREPQIETSGLPASTMGTRRPPGAVSIFGAGSSIADAIKARRDAADKKDIATRNPTDSFTGERNTPTESQDSSEQSERAPVPRNEDNKPTKAVDPVSKVSTTSLFDDDDDDIFGRQPPSVVVEQDDSPAAKEVNVNPDLPSVIETTVEETSKQRVASFLDSDDDDIFGRVPPPTSNVITDNVAKTDIFGDRNSFDDGDIFGSTSKDNIDDDIFSDIPPPLKASNQPNDLDGDIFAQHLDTKSKASSDISKPAVDGDIGSVVPKVSKEVDDIFGNDVDIFASKPRTKPKRKKKRDTKKKLPDTQTDIFADPLGALDD